MFVDGCLDGFVHSLPAVLHELPQQEILRSALMPDHGNPIDYSRTGIGQLPAGQSAQEVLRARVEKDSRCAENVSLQVAATTASPGLQVRLVDVDQVPDAAQVLADRSSTCAFMALPHSCA